MPIEIKELNIKINVSENQNKPATGTESSDKNMQNSIINQCVEQVMEIISKTHER